ncbi:MAG: GTP cyclohydrolase II [Terracidiphilus sp.]
MTTLKPVAELTFPTRWATFRLLAFESFHIDRKSGKRCCDTALALVLGDIHNSPPLVRIHSQCVTGDVLHSLRCDCHDQLHLALRTIVAERGGILLYEQQEGRGIGLLEKLRAYELQDRGFDTVEANLQLGHAIDSRDYALAVAILQSLEVHSIRLMSNNPDKIMAVSSAGIRIVERVGADVPASPHSAHYIATKREKLGHLSNAAAVSPGFESREAEGAFPGKLCSEANGSRAEARANL